MKIPPKFCRGDYQPVAYTVGQLKALLAELPDELPIRQGFGEGAVVIVFNATSGDPFLEFNEPE